MAGSLVASYRLFFSFVVVVLAKICRLRLSDTGERYDTGFRVYQDRYGFGRPDGGHGEVIPNLVRAVVVS